MSVFTSTRPSQGALMKVSNGSIWQVAGHRGERPNSRSAVGPDDVGYARRCLIADLSSALQLPAGYEIFRPAFVRLGIYLRQGLDFPFRRSGRRRTKLQCM
jgi:hypothetical protein